MNRRQLLKRTASGILLASLPVEDSFRRFWPGWTPRDSSPSRDSGLTRIDGDRYYPIGAVLPDQPLAVFERKITIGPEVGIQYHPRTIEVPDYQLVYDNVEQDYKLVIGPTFYPVRFSRPFDV